MLAPVEAGEVAVVGAGAWGTAVAGLIASKVHEVAGSGRVSLWARRPELAREIAAARCNHAYLPGVALPTNLDVSSSLGDVLEGAALVVLAVPSRWAREVLGLGSGSMLASAAVLSLVKGIEPSSLLPMSSVVTEVTGRRAVAVLSGPNLADEIAAGLPAATVVASQQPELASRVRDLLASAQLRVYVHDDVTGCELAGAGKNVLALGAGMADSLGAGNNARAALITRGVAELSRLGAAMGGHPLTFSGLAGLGDVVLTCTSERSRNRSVGYSLGTGRSLAETVGSLGHVAEGVTTAPAIVELARRHGVELPICEAVAAVVEGRLRPDEAVTGLLGRRPRHELEGHPTWPVPFAPRC